MFDYIAYTSNRMLISEAGFRFLLTANGGNAAITTYNNGSPI